MPVAASTAAATATSKPLPDFGSAAGNRPTVTRLSGHGWPLLMTADFTRSRAS